MSLQPGIHSLGGRRRARRAQGGFTLIELMVAMVVSAIVVLGVYAFSSIQQSTASLHERNVRVQQALEGAMWTMAQDVRAAGLGYTRLCTELRVYDRGTSQLINPGAVADPALAMRDAITGEAYWVLRDGLQAHWQSSLGADLPGDLARSSSLASVADSFDVMMADSAYVGSYGVFRLAAPVASGDTFISMRSSPLLDNGDVAHLAQVQQLFPPGTFFIVARTPAPGQNPFRPEIQGQCALLQITGDVQPGVGDPQLWQLPVSGTVSGFDADLGLLFDTSLGVDDWGAADGVIDSSIVPLGRLRWSRYEIDYAIPTRPYLVRYDIIGYREDTDPNDLGAASNYPHCTAGQCPAPQLHLPGGDSPPVAVAVGPMIEDMQVAVGCDGYTAISAAAATPAMVPPDLGFEELGPVAGPTAGLPNFQIDENASGNGRDTDEWLGNARSELTAPDCVYYGTAQRAAAQWIAIEGDQSPPPAFRMSPQTVRITVVGSSETEEAAGGLATTDVLAVEDRPPVASPVGNRQRFTLTEVFSPKNARWRDPTVL